jgi:hypothetical protein
MKLSIRLIALFALFLSLGLGMASCLKDKDFDDGLIQSVHGSQPNMIEVKLNASSATNFLSLIFDPINRDTTLNFIPVNLSTAGSASEDINVTLVQKNSLVDDYNTANGTSFAVPPASMFTVINAGGVVTIPKGSNTGYLQLKLKPTNFLGGSWALGYQINAVDKSGYTISKNLGTGIVAIGVKNQYEGLYHAVGHFEHPTLPRDIDMTDVEVVTVNANTVNKLLGDLTTASINITINADNTVTITPGSENTGTTASVAGMSTVGIYNNTYDPATHTFYLRYGYPQPGPTRIITEVVTKQ